MTCLAVTDGVISGIGRERDLVGSADRDTIVIDCGGRALLPGIVDEHCHIFAAAATSSGVDCRPAATPTVDAVVRALRTAKFAATAGSAGTVTTIPRWAWGGIWTEETWMPLALTFQSGWIIARGTRAS